MTFIEIAQPTWFERMVILGVQGVFLVGFSILYLFSSRTAHRIVGYFEEEAVTSYTLYLQEIDEGRSPTCRRRLSPSITGRWQTMRHCAMSCSSFATMRRITAT